MTLFLFLKTISLLRTVKGLKPVFPLLKYDCVIISTTNGSNPHFRQFTPSTPGDEKLSPYPCRSFNRYWSVMRYIIRYKIFHTLSCNTKIQFSLLNCWWTVWNSVDAHVHIIPDHFFEESATLFFVTFFQSPTFTKLPNFRRIGPPSPTSLNIPSVSATRRSSFGLSSLFASPLTKRKSFSPSQSGKQLFKYAQL